MNFILVVNQLFTMNFSYEVLLKFAGHNLC